MILKKKLVRVALAWWLCVAAVMPSSSQTRADTLRAIMLGGCHPDYIMIDAHRGGGYYHRLENSLEAFREAIEIGLDIIELDIQTTKDGCLMVIHDDTLDRTTNGSGKIGALTFDEVRQLRLVTRDGEVTDEPVPTFEDVLDLCKGRILIHVDKWNVTPSTRKKIFATAQKKGCLNQIVVRTRASESILKRKNARIPQKVILVHLILESEGDVAEAKYDEALAEASKSPLGMVFADEYYVGEWMRRLTDDGRRWWISALAGRDGGHGDRRAVNDIDAAYGWMVDQGFSIITTDQPKLLLQYLTEKGKRQWPKDINTLH